MQQTHAMQMNAANMHAAYTNYNQCLVEWGTKDPVIISPTLKCERPREHCNFFFTPSSRLHLTANSPTLILQTLSNIPSPHPIVNILMNIPAKTKAIT